MTGNKRFTFADGFKIVAIRENGEIMNSIRVCDKLNELYEENNELKQEIEALKMEIVELKESESDNYNITDGLW